MRRVVFCMFALVTVTTNFALLHQGSTVSAQTASSVVVSALFDHSPQRTESGGPVIAFLVDPLMPAQQEAEILQFMRRPCPFDWNGDSTLVDIRRDIAAHVAIEIDWRGFAEIGIDPKMAVYPDLAIGSKRIAAPVAKSNSAQDPFAVTAASTPSTAARIDNRESDPAWWRKRKTPFSATEISTAARLLYFLDQLDSTITIRQGQLIVTTLERAEQQCCVRIYDVTPIVTLEIPDQFLDRSQSNGSMFDAQSLIDMIQTAVTPDTWECLGGPSTTQVYSCRDRQWLIACTPLVTHWKIQELLNKINQ